jgi:hypothetical protein
MTAAIEIDGTRFGNAQVTNLSGQTLFLSSVKLTYYHGSRRLRKISIVFACLEQKNFVQTTSLSDLLLPVWTGASETQVVTVQAMLDEIKDKLKTSTIKLISLKALSSPPEAALARPAAQLRKQKEAATDNAVIKGVQAELKKENRKRKQHSLPWRTPSLRYRLPWIAPAHVRVPDPDLAHVHHLPTKDIATCTEAILCTSIIIIIVLVAVAAVAIAAAVAAVAAAAHAITVMAAVTRDRVQIA